MPKHCLGLIVLAIASLVGGCATRSVEAIESSPPAHVYECEESAPDTLSGIASICSPDVLDFHQRRIVARSTPPLMATVSAVVFRVDPRSSSACTVRMWNDGLGNGFGEMIWGEYAKSLNKRGIAYREIRAETSDVR